MKSRIGCPKSICAGDNFVSGSGVFLYWSTAIAKLSLSRVPFGPVLPVINLFIVLTPISAQQFECGKATDDRQ